MMATRVSGTIRLLGDTPCSTIAPQSAANGQSLPQSGNEGLPGQQGMSSVALTSVPATTCSLMPGMVAETAMTGRAIGADTRPRTAATSKIRVMPDSTII
jgi:hypothetical protein